MSVIFLFTYRNDDIHWDPSGQVFELYGTTVQPQKLYSSERTDTNITFQKLGNQNNTKEQGQKFSTYWNTYQKNFTVIEYIVFFVRESCFQYPAIMKFFGFDIWRPTIIRSKVGKGLQRAGSFIFN